MSARKKPPRGKGPMDDQKLGVGVPRPKTRIDGDEVEARVARGFGATDPDVDCFVRMDKSSYVDVHMRDGLTFRIHDKKDDEEHAPFEVWVSDRFSRDTLHNPSVSRETDQTTVIGWSWVGETELRHAEQQAIAIAQQERATAVRMTQTAFRWIGVLLPPRIRDEEIGDALEDIHRIINDPACPDVCRAVRWKIASTYFWLAWHAIRRIIESIRGKRTG